MTEFSVDRLLEEQQRYYRARAPEYDDWWFRRGGYRLDPETAARWFSDVHELEASLEVFAPRGDVLELAAGTGLWTSHLLRHADRVTAVDAVAAMLDRNRVRTNRRAEYIVADVFTWQPPRAFDVCFFGFWHSHVPSNLFGAFWELVSRALKPDGRVFFVDNAQLGDSSHLVSANGEVARRRVSDGREFDIVKRFWAPSELERELALIGWTVAVRTTANGHFIAASGTRASTLRVNPGRDRAPPRHPRPTPHHDDGA
jgi:demethylmenaquinone methyltransferase/2-methoxy-6-polyprenyl-1,4-benzoquinol methylase